MIQAMRPTSRDSTEFFRIILLLCCWLGFRHPFKLSYKVLATSNSSLPSSSPISCSLYLAPSTIPGAGLGIFAGSKGFDYDDRVSYGDVVVPLEGINYHNGKSLVFLWDEYTWTAGQFPGMDQELGDDSIAKVNGASPGFGKILLLFSSSEAKRQFNFLRIHWQIPLSFLYCRCGDQLLTASSQCQRVRQLDEDE